MHHQTRSFNRLYRFHHIPIWILAKLRSTLWKWRPKWDCCARVWLPWHQKPWLVLKLLHLFPWLPPRPREIVSIFSTKLKMASDKFGIGHNFQLIFYSSFPWSTRKWFKIHFHSRFYWQAHQSCQTCCGNGRRRNDEVMEESASSLRVCVWNTVSISLGSSGNWSKTSSFSPTLMSSVSTMTWAFPTEIKQTIRYKAGVK